MARILVVEDETDLGGLLEYNLRAEGHSPEWVRTGAAAIARVKSDTFELVLLDLMLPDVAGADVARMIRSHDATRRLPIIMVTAKASEDDRVLGLQLGADDYVVKPFSVKELLLRVKAVLRRHEEPPQTSRLTVGALTLDSERHQVTSGSAPVNLTALEFKLLRTLMERRGRVQSREVLVSDVWGTDTEVSERTVDTQIKRLREKLGAGGDLIGTIRGVGYKLEG